MYPETTAGVQRHLEAAADADNRGRSQRGGRLRRLLESAVLSLKSARTLVAFWDVDAPATLDRIGRPATLPRAGPPSYDLILTYGGGAPVVAATGVRGAAVRAHLQRPRSRNASRGRARSALHRRSRVHRPTGCPTAKSALRNSFRGPAHSATRASSRRKRLGRRGAAPQRPLGRTRVYGRSQRVQLPRARSAQRHPRQHGAYGYSPATRIFEAAGSCACIVSDAWEGIEEFFEPGPKSWWRQTVPKSPCSDAADAGAGAADRRRGASPGAPSTPMRGGSRSSNRYWRGASHDEPALANVCGRLPPSSDRGPRTVDHIVVGQRTRDHLSRTVARAVPARPRGPVPGVRLPWYRAHRDITGSACGRPCAYYQDSTICGSASRRDPQRRSRDRRLVCPGRIAIGHGCGVATGIIAFYDIDTPVTLAKLARAETCYYLEAALIPGYDLYLSFTGGPTLRGSERVIGASARRACTVASIRNGTVPARQAGRMGARLSRHVQRRSPAGARGSAVQPARR